MSYRQKLTYRKIKSLSNRSPAGKRPSIVTTDLDKMDDVKDTSPVGAVKDTYGYMGFTSQDS